MIDPSPLLERSITPVSQWWSIPGVLGSGAAHASAASIDSGFPRSPTLPGDEFQAGQAERKGTRQWPHFSQKEVPAMVVTAITTALYAVTYGGLCFDAYGLQNTGGSVYPNGYTMWLLCGMVGQIANQLFSDMPIALSNGTLELLPIVWAIFDNIADTMRESDQDAVLGTCMATLFVSTLGLGIMLFVGGLIGVANWLRVVPAVVLKGALFGIGLFLLRTSLDNANAVLPLCMRDWSHWGIVVLLGSSLFICDQTWNSPVAIMTVLLAIGSAPTLLIGLGAFTFDDMSEGGWLVQGSGMHTRTSGAWYDEFFAVYRVTIPRVHWDVVLLQMPSIAGLWATHLLCTLVDLKTIEVIMQIDVDLNKELQAVGAGNILGALCGCIWPVYTPTGPNITAKRMGAETSIGGWVKVLTTALLLFTLPNLVPMLPTALPCTVTFWLGLTFMKESMLNIFVQHAHGFDVVIVAVMAAVCWCAGLLCSLLVGSLLAVLSFTFLYTGLSPVVRLVDTASFIHSNVQRSLAEMLMLERLGRRIAVLHLEGYIMFGSSPQLLDAVRPLLEEDGPTWIVISLRSVQGLDYSAICDISYLGRRAKAAGKSIVLTEIRGAVQKAIDRAGLNLKEVDEVVLDDEDVPKGLCHIKHYQPALRRCEDALLHTIPLMLSGWKDTGEEESLPIMVLRKGFGDYLDGGAEDLAKLLSYFEVQELPEGETVWKAGEAADFALGVLQGQLHCFIDSASLGGEPVLMEVVSVGAFVGMFSVMNLVPYSHTVVVPCGSGPCAVLRLTVRSFTALTQDDPRIVNALLRGFIRRAGYEWRLLSRMAAHV